MNFRSLPGYRAAILGIISILTVAVSVPWIVSAQDASPEASPAVSDEQAQIERGSFIFNNVCIACHQPDGKGIEGIYLPLAGNPAVTLEDPTYFITVLLNGRGGMPRFDSTYDDEEIAAIATFIRQNWENDAPAVTAEQVAAVRASIEQEAVTTPEGQKPEGSGRQGGTPVATPDATPST